MRQVFAVEALVDLEPGADVRAIGGAVTLALCGAFEHPGPCPLAPHRTTVERQDAHVRARIVGACEAGQADAVMRLVIDGLRAGVVVDPDGAEQRWRLRSCAAAELRGAELEFADRLASD